MKSLEETIPDMCSLDYKDRMRAEYHQVSIRKMKLDEMIDKYHSGKLEFTLTCSIALLEHQAELMRGYMNCLETRCRYEGVDITDSEGQE